VLLRLGPGRGKWALSGGEKAKKNVSSPEGKEDSSAMAWRRPAKQSGARRQSGNPMQGEKKTLTDLEKEEGKKRHD